eukprot:3377872-Amphidinium_carterae.1
MARPLKLPLILCWPRFNNCTLKGYEEYTGTKCTVHMGDAQLQMTWPEHKLEAPELRVGNPCCPTIMNSSSADGPPNHLHIWGLSLICNGQETPL